MVILATNVVAFIFIVLNLNNLPSQLKLFGTIGLKYGVVPNVFINRNE